MADPFQKPPCTPLTKRLSGFMHRRQPSQDDALSKSPEEFRRTKVAKRASRASFPSISAFKSNRRSRSLDDALRQRRVSFLDLPRPSFGEALPDADELYASVSNSIGPLLPAADNHDRRVDTQYRRIETEDHVTGNHMAAQPETAREEVSAPGPSAQASSSCLDNAPLHASGSRDATPLIAGLRRSNAGRRTTFPEGSRPISLVLPERSRRVSAGRPLSTGQLIEHTYRHAILPVRPSGARLNDPDSPAAAFLSLNQASAPLQLSSPEMGLNAPGPSAARKPRKRIMQSLRRRFSLDSGTLLKSTEPVEGALQQSISGTTITCHCETCTCNAHQMGAEHPKMTEGNASEGRAPASSSPPNDSSPASHAEPDHPQTTEVNASEDRAPVSSPPTLSSPPNTHSSTAPASRAPPLAAISSASGSTYSRFPKPKSTSSGFQRTPASYSPAAKGSESLLTPSSNRAPAAATATAGSSSSLGPTTSSLPPPVPPRNPARLQHSRRSDNNSSYRCFAVEDPGDYSDSGVATWTAEDINYARVVAEYADGEAE